MRSQSSSTTIFLDSQADPMVEEVAMIDLVNMGLIIMDEVEGGI